MLTRWGLFTLLLSAGLPASPNTLSVPLTHTEIFDSSTAVINLRRGEVHPPLFINGILYDWANYTRSIPLGDGRHGAFVPARYHVFSKDGDLSGNIIRLPLDKFPTLQVTDFHLAEGWTLEPVGDQPLLIYSQGDALIEGVILCSGHPGAEGLENATYPSLGGGGRCGGRPGGASGEPGADGLGVSSTGGGPGGSSSTGSGGGGGGGGGFAYSDFPGSGGAEDGDGGLPPSPAHAVGGSRGLSDTSVDEFLFTNLAGGAGGGGGGASFGHSGGGGGAGGGVVVLHAAGFLHVTATGSVLAEGGAGGEGFEDGAYSSGEGGQGGGGSILMTSLSPAPPPAAPNQFNLIEGHVSAMDIQTHKGAGATGRTWLASSGSSPNGFSGNSPVPFTWLTYQGEVEYQTGSFDFLSRPIAVKKRKVILSSVEPAGKNLTNGSVDVRVRGGSSLEDLNSRSFVNLTELELPENLRYLQFEFTLTNNHAQEPFTLEALHFGFELGDVFEFNYVGQCSQMAPPGSVNGWLWLALMLLPLALLRALRGRVSAARV